jgi:hypothetical protein
MYLLTVFKLPDVSRRGEIEFKLEYDDRKKNPNQYRKQCLDGLSYMDFLMKCRYVHNVDSIS